jgi:TPR repeat protein
MRIRSLALVFSLSLCSLTAFAQREVPDISLNGEILWPTAAAPQNPLIADATSHPQSQQSGGYYKPVTPVPYQRKCGTVSTDICAVPVTIPPGATGAQVYQMMKDAANSGRTGEALSYLEKSAELGYPPAEGALGVDYLRGIGEQANTEKGVYWLNLAAQHGERGAQELLGECFENGSDNVRRDEARAIAFYKQAAAQHQSLAEYRLGMDYEIGRGVAHNRATAIEYLRRASADGQQQAGVTANFLARAGSAQYHSVGEIDAAMNPPAPTGNRAGATNCFPQQLNETWRPYCARNPGCTYNSYGRPYTCPK